MLRPGPEHRSGWHARLIVDGIAVEVIARHSTRRRVPHGNDLARQVARHGRVTGLVEEKTHEWLVRCPQGVVGTLRQHDNGAFHMANQLLGFVPIERAVVDAFRLLAAPRLRTASGPAAPDAPDDATPPGAGPRR